MSEDAVVVGGGGAAPVTLRAEHSDDAGFLFDLYSEIRRDELAATGWSAPQIQAFLRFQFGVQRRAYASAYPDGRFQIILCAGRRAGRFYVAASANESRVVDLAISAPYRNQGVGGALLRGLIAEAERRQRPVRFHVEQANRAIRLYERLGFKRVAQNGPYFLMEFQPDPPGPPS